MITTICMLARDQDLRITRIPTVANGNVNTVEIDVKTDQMWEGFSLSAVFFNSEKGPVYEILLADGKCTVPHEVLEKKTTLHIGLRGTAPDQKKVSTLVTYDIKKGAPESNATAEGPTPDVYQQILKRLDEINFGVSDERIEKAVRKYLENNPVNVVVDDALLEESENPVQNKVITKEIRELSERIGRKYVTPQMFGAKCDGVTDDTESINKALRAHNNVYFPKGTYLVSGHYSWYGTAGEGGIQVKSNQRILMDQDCILKQNSVRPEGVEYEGVELDGLYNIISVAGTVDEPVENVVIEGGKIEGYIYQPNENGGLPVHVQGYGVAFVNAKNCILRGVEIYNTWASGIMMHSRLHEETTTQNTGILIEDCIIHDCRRQGMSFCVGDHITVRNCEIYNISGSNPQSGIGIEPTVDIETGEARNYVHDVLFENVHIHDTVGASVSYSVCYNVTFTNMRCDNLVNAVGLAYNILHTHCFYSRTLQFSRDIYDVMVSGCVIALIYLSGNPKVNFANCIIRGIDVDGSLATIIQAPSFTGKATYEGCKLILTNCEKATYRYFLWTDAAATGDFVFRNCDIGIVDGYKFTYLFSTKATTVSLHGCSIDHVSESSQIAPIPRKLKIIDCDLTSESALGFTVANDQVFTFIAANSRLNLKQYVCYLTVSDAFASGYSLVIANNLLKADSAVNANITNLLKKAIVTNNQVYSVV